MPAAHGGFETFAEHLSQHLVARGWRVIVYCQESGQVQPYEDVWQGIHRHHISVVGDGPHTSMIFDWHATRHAAKAGDLCLTLGYNTAVFCALLRQASVYNVINMDGIEWRRAKWGPAAKCWFWLNERAGSWLGNRLVADHPEITAHLSRAVSPAKISMIPYGADRLHGLSDEPVRALGLVPGRFLTLIARPEPENSVLEAVEGFSRRPRDLTLAVLGTYRDDNAYHRAVRAAAGAEVRFLGAIYEKPVVQALRFHSIAYVHGHQVGGTNPSLVEALGAGNAVIAHDNRFNRWVAGDAARYFTHADDFATILDRLIENPSEFQPMRAAAVRRFESEFTWAAVLQAYEALLSGLAASGSAT